MKLFLLFVSCLLLAGPRLANAQIKNDPSKTARIVAITPQESPTVLLNGGTMRMLVDSADTHGEWSMAALTENTRYLTPVHRHTWDESFYVLEGTLTAMLDGRYYELPAGSFLLIPRGTVHAQGNRDSTPVKLLLTMRPSGFEHHLKDRAELYKKIKPSEPGFPQAMDSLRRKNAAYIEVIGPWNVPAKPAPLPNHQ